jgi:hypothetical protein
LCLETSEIRFMYGSPIEKIPSAIQAYDYRITFAGFCTDQNCNITIRLLVSCQANDLIWNWKALRRRRIKVYITIPKKFQSIVSV